MNRLRAAMGPPCPPPGRMPGLAGNLIIRYHDCMRTVTATEASRHFSDLLDAVERGETVTIVRGSHSVAEIGPARRRTGADLRAALTDTAPPDDAFARSISEAMSMVTSEAGDPWADA
jgi:prevent-host-death family protein